MLCSIFTFLAFIFILMHWKLSKFAQIIMNNMWFFPPSLTLADKVLVSDFFVFLCQYVLYSNYVLFFLYFSRTFCSLSFERVISFKCKWKCMNDSERKRNAEFKNIYLQSANECTEWRMKKIARMLLLYVCVWCLLDTVLFIVK